MMLRMLHLTRILDSRSLDARMMPRMLRIARILDPRSLDARILDARILDARTLEARMMSTMMVTILDGISSGIYLGYISHLPLRLPPIYLQYQGSHGYLIPRDNLDKTHSIPRRNRISMPNPIPTHGMAENSISHTIPYLSVVLVH